MINASKVDRLLSKIYSSSSRYNGGELSWEDKKNEDRAAVQEWAQGLSPPPNDGPFQDRVAKWMSATFDGETVTNKTERNHRFLEESLELVQSLGCTQAEAHMLVDYVFGRPIGECEQETGGVMVTLAALANASNIRINRAAETELDRCWTKIEQIRTKQAGKPRHSPLPGPSETKESTLCKHDDGDCHEDDPCDNCPRFRREAATSDPFAAAPLTGPGSRLEADLQTMRGHEKSVDIGQLEPIYETADDCTSPIVGYRDLNPPRIDDETPAPLACGVDTGFGFGCRRARGHAGPHTWDPKPLYGEDPVSEGESP